MIVDGVAFALAVFVYQLIASRLPKRITGPSDARIGLWFGTTAIGSVVLFSSISTVH